MFLSLLAGQESGGDHPFGALLLTAEGEEIEGMNAVESEGDPSAHAELRVLQSAARKLGPQQLKGATLYSSAEPCAMCGGGHLLVRGTTCRLPVWMSLLLPKRQEEISAT